MMIIFSMVVIWPTFHLYISLQLQETKVWFEKSLLWLISFVTWVFFIINLLLPLHWRHNGHDDVSNHQPYHCLLNRLFWRRSKKTSKLRVTGLCAGNSPETGEFPAQMSNDAGIFHLMTSSWILQQPLRTNWQFDMLYLVYFNDTVVHFRVWAIHCHEICSRIKILIISIPLNYTFKYE